VRDLGATLGFALMGSGIVTMLAIVIVSVAFPSPGSTSHPEISLSFILTGAIIIAIWDLGNRIEKLLQPAAKQEGQVEAPSATGPEQ